MSDFQNNLINQQQRQPQMNFPFQQNDLINQMNQIQNNKQSHFFPFPQPQLNPNQNFNNINMNQNMNMNNNNEYMEEGEEEYMDNSPNEEENQNMANNNYNIENENINENDNENYEEDMYENEEDNEFMGNEDDIETNQIIQEIDDYILNNENINKFMKNFIANVKKKIITLSQENNQLKLYNYNLINLKEQNISLRKRNLQLQNMLNQYKSNPSSNYNIESTKGEILKLNNKINNYEIALSKSNLEKKLLETKLDNLKNDYNRKLTLMNNYKKSELQSVQKQLNELKKNEMKNNYDSIMNKRMLESRIKEDSKFYIDKINILEEKNDKLSNDNFALDEENKKFRNKIQSNSLNMKYKDDLIKSLNEKLKKISSKYQSMINSLEKSNEQSQFQIEQLFNENDKYKKENEMLVIEMNKLRENLAGYNLEKKESNNILNNYRERLNKYKINIMVLKQRINELLKKDDINRIDNEYNNLMRYKSSLNFFHQ